MTTVETKIKVFERMILEKDLFDARKKLGVAISQNESAVAEAKKTCLHQREEYLKQIKEKAMADQVKIVLKAKEEAKQQILRKKQELLEKMNGQVIQKMEAFADTDAYADYFLQRFEMAMAEFQEKADLLIGVRTKDLNLIKEKSSVVVDETIIGGFYLIQSKKVKYDYTLNREVESVRDELGLAIHALLQPIGGEASRE